MIEEDLEVLEVIPPTRREQPATWRGCDLRSPLDEKPDQRGIPCAGHRLEQRGALVTTVRLVDRQAAIQQQRSHSPRLRFGLLQILAGGRARQMQQVATLAIRDAEQRRPRVQLLAD